MHLKIHGAFSNWLSFGGDAIRSGALATAYLEQEKRVTCRDSAADAVMLPDLADPTDVLARPREDGHDFTPEQVARLGPYMSSRCVGILHVSLKYPRYASIFDGTCRIYVDPCERQSCKYMREVILSR